MKPYQKQKKNFLSARKKPLLIGLGVIVVLALGVFGAAKADIIDLPFLDKKADQPAPTSQNQDINYNPPTEEEKKETEEFKDKQGNQTQTPPPPTGSDGKKIVTPMISSWGQNPATNNVEISGFVSNAYEDGGTCTFTFTMGSQKVTQAKAATKDARNVSCGLTTVERSRFSPGTWSVTLTYSSATSQGTSQPVTLEVR